MSGSSASGPAPARPRRRDRRRRRAPLPVLVLLPLVVVAAVLVQRVAAPGEPPVRYYLIAHPDDEFQAWSMVEEPGHLPVFVLLTRGEQTGQCGNAEGLQEERGERRPPQGYPLPNLADDPTRPSACEEARVDAFTWFLDRMSEAGELGPATDRGEHLAPASAVPQRYDPVAGRDGEVRQDAEDARRYRLWVGPRQARVVYNLGDGDLTRTEVQWAVDHVRSLHAAGTFGARGEEGAVAAGYWGDDQGSVRYTHPDHGAVQDVLRDTDLGLPGPQVGRTGLANPGAAFTRTVSAAAYAAAMDVSGPADPCGNPDARREGALQRAYGWLAFAFEGDPCAGPYWRGDAQDDAVTVFNRDQAFWTRS